MQITIKKQKIINTLLLEVSESRLTFDYIVSSFSTMPHLLTLVIGEQLFSLVATCAL